MCLRRAPRLPYQEENFDHQARPRSTVNFDPALDRFLQNKFPTKAFAIFCNCTSLHRSLAVAMSSCPEQHRIDEGSQQDPSSAKGTIASLSSNIEQLEKLVHGHFGRLESLRSKLSSLRPATPPSGMSPCVGQLQLKDEGAQHDTPKEPAAALSSNVEHLKKLLHRHFDALNGMTAQISALGPQPASSSMGSCVGQLASVEFRVTVADANFAHGDQVYVTGGDSPQRFLSLQPCSCHLIEKWEMMSFTMVQWSENSVVF